MRLLSLHEMYRQAVWKLELVPFVVHAWDNSTYLSQSFKISKQGFKNNFRACSLQVTMLDFAPFTVRAQKEYDLFTRLILVLRLYPNLN